ncbi:MAG: hypothetical protein ACI8TA_002591 [Cyclobacteriaceae bacterium]
MEASCIFILLLSFYISGIINIVFSKPFPIIYTIG